MQEQFKGLPAMARHMVKTGLKAGGYARKGQGHARSSLALLKAY